MRFDQLTIKAQEAVTEAQREARARGSAEMTPDHLLLALLRQTEGVVPPILAKLGVNANGSRDGSREGAGPLAPRLGRFRGRFPLP